MLYRLEVKDSGQTAEKDFAENEKPKEIAAALMALVGSVTASGRSWASLFIGDTEIANFSYPSPSIEVRFEDPVAPVRPAMPKPPLWLWGLVNKARTERGSTTGVSGDLESAISAALDANRRSPVRP